MRSEQVRRVYSSGVAKTPGKKSRHRLRIRISYGRLIGRGETIFRHHNEAAAGMQEAWDKAREAA